jgi:hypothetical protein
MNMGNLLIKFIAEGIICFCFMLFNFIKYWLFLLLLFYKFKKKKNTLTIRLFLLKKICNAGYNIFMQLLLSSVLLYLLQSINNQSIKKINNHVISKRFIQYAYLFKKLYVLLWSRLCKIGLSKPHIALIKVLYYYY